MLLGEKVGPYIRPNPASFTRNLDQDRIGRINWDETAGVQECFLSLDSGFRRNDGKGAFGTSYETVKFLFVSAIWAF